MVTRRCVVERSSWPSVPGRIIRPSHTLPEDDIMRHVSFITTVALLLLIPGNPRAQAPALNREVPPVLPIKQVAYIKASNAEAYDHFACGGGNQGHTGTSIAISGDANT